MYEKRSLKIFGYILGENKNFALSSPWIFRDCLTRKNCCLPPPPSSQFRQLVQLFSDVKIQDLKVSLGLKILFIHLGNNFDLWKMRKHLKLIFGS